jgi:hypothetical protein
MRSAERKKAHDIDQETAKCQGHRNGRSARKRESAERGHAYRKPHDGTSDERNDWRRDFELKKRKRIGLTHHSHVIAHAESRSDVP